MEDMSLVHLAQYNNVGGLFGIRATIKQMSTLTSLRVVEVHFL